MPAICLILALFDTSCPPANTAALIAQLGSQSFRTREDATHQLAALGNRARGPLERAAAEGDPETVSRARRLLAGLWEMPGPPLPWIDLTSWPKPMQPWAACYLDKARAYHAGWAGTWGDYREACRLWLVDMRRAGIADWVVRGIVEVMRTKEQEYRRRHNVAAEF